MFIGRTSVITVTGKSSGNLRLRCKNNIRDKRRQASDKLISMTNSLKEGLKKLSIKSNREPWDKDEDAVRKSREAGDSGARGVTAEGFSVDPTATQMNGIPRGLGANFRFYVTGAQRRDPVRLGGGLSDRLGNSGMGVAAMRESAHSEYTLVQQTLVICAIL